MNRLIVNAILTNIRLDIDTIQYLGVIKHSNSPINFNEILESTSIFDIDIVITRLVQPYLRVKSAVLCGDAAGL